MSDDLERQIKIMADALAKGKPRTVKDYVDCMTARGRTLSQILVVAHCSRWKGQEQKIKETYHERASV